MTEDEFKALKPGDTIVNRKGANYTVIDNYTNYAGHAGKALVTDDGRKTFEFPWSADEYKLTAVSHYTVSGIPESWEVIEALQASWPKEVVFHLGNVGKYWFRLGRKQGASVESDLKKLIDYAQRALKIVQAK